MEEMDPPSSMPRRRIYSVTGRFAPKLVKYIFDVHKRKKILVWHELFVLRKSQIWKIDFPVKNITLTLRQEIIKLFLLSQGYTQKFFFVLYLTRLTLLNCRRQRWASVHACAWSISNKCMNRSAIWVRTGSNLGTNLLYLGAKRMDTKQPWGLNLVVKLWSKGENVRKILF